jgi:hypothetical protein
MKRLMAYVIEGRWTLLINALFANNIVNACNAPESSSMDWS